jgi:putative inorganic carbon (hco3(-)) transporter
MIGARSVPVEPTDRARGAFLWFCAFVVGIYCSAPQLIPALEKLNPGKTLIALAIVALMWSVVLCRRPLRLGLAAGGTPLYLFFGVVIFSSLWSPWPTISRDAASEAVKFLAAFFVAVNVLDTRDRIRTGATVLALAALFPTYGAIYSKLTGSFLVEGSRAAWIGGFGNPNFLAYSLVLAIPLALALRDTVKPGPRAALTKLAWLGAIALMCVAVLLTASRGGALGMGAVLLLWTIRSLAKGRIAVGAVVAVFVALMMAPGGPWDREETGQTLSGHVDASTQGRIDAWRTAKNIVEEHPITGVGIGAFMAAYDRYAPGDAGQARTAHNSFAMIAAEMGLPALLLFIMALGGAFISLGRVARDGAARPAIMARGVQTSLFGFVVCSQTGGYTFSWPLYFILGLAAAITLRERPEQERA